MADWRPSVMPPFTEEGSSLLVFPCSGTALDALLSLPPGCRFVGYVDDAFSEQGRAPDGHPVYGRDAFDRWPEARVLAMPGDERSLRKRAGLIDGLGLPRHRFATVIDASARVSPLARIGHNVLIMLGVVISSNVVIEDDVCVLPNSVLHHGVIIGRYSHVGANVTIGGGSVIGRGCQVCSGSCLGGDIGVGDGACIGLGSAVVRHVGPGATVTGNPARRLR